MWIFLGLTGLSGSGKDTFASIISFFARQREIQVFCKKLSDEVINELSSRSITNGELTRAKLIETGNYLRTTYGNGILASRVIDKFHSIFAENQDINILSVITGIRNPEEVKVFRHQWCDKFILVSIESDNQIRSDRIALRRQYREDMDPSHDVEKADQDIGIKFCQEMADFHVLNNGCVEELRKSIGIFFDDNVFPLFYMNDNKFIRVHRPTSQL